MRRQKRAFYGNFYKMPDRCVVYGCDNTANVEKKISLHRIPYFDDQCPEAKTRRKSWVDFVGRYRDKWQATKNSVICSEHFKKEDYCNMFSSVEGQSETVTIHPRLKRDSIGICVVPSVHKPKEVTATISERSRRMVKKVITFWLKLAIRTLMLLSFSHRY